MTCYQVRNGFEQNSYVQRPKEIDQGSSWVGKSMSYAELSDRIKIDLNTCEGDLEYLFLCTWGSEELSRHKDNILPEQAKMKHLEALPVETMDASAHCLPGISAWLRLLLSFNSNPPNGKATYSSSQALNRMDMNHGIFFCLNLEVCVKFYWHKNFCSSLS